MDCVKIGQFIAERRRELGYTQNAVAERLGISDKAVSKWERGLSLPDITLFGEIANLLKCSIGELMEGKMNLFNSSKISDGQDSVQPLPSLDCDESAQFNYDSAVTVSPLLFGDNLEHTRACINGGLSAQMLKNRKFAGKPRRDGCAHEWYRIGDTAYLLFEEGYTKHSENYHMNRMGEQNSLAIVNFDASRCGVGQKEIFFDENTEYEFRAVVKSTKDVTAYISLKDNCGNTVSEEEIGIGKGGYTTYTKVFKPCVTGEMSLEFYFYGKATVTVGAFSLMNNDNFHGMRKDVIECMKQIGIKILRWPGGNFSGEYNWKDGLLPADMRSPFCALCREIGAEPFITINPAWNTPGESGQWVEYCNGDENTEYGRLRIERGLYNTAEYHSKEMLFGQKGGISAALFP